jgi:hypothetical protein
MNRQTTDDLPALTYRGTIPRDLPIGTVIDRWPCPCCDRTVTMIRRPGRPRLYCSQACRQRAYRWRRCHRAHTTSTPSWPAASAWVSNGKDEHALRTGRDPLSRQRDRRGREVTVCGVLARPKRRPGGSHSGAPFLRATPFTCRACEALTQPRPLGLVPPGATPPPRALERGDSSTIDALRVICRRYPLDPVLRHLLDTLWAA